MKNCSKCGVAKPLDDFYRHPTTTDGRFGKCKECTKSDTRDYQHGHGRERVLAYNRTRKYKHKQSPESRRGTARRYRLKYPDKVKCHRAVQYAVSRGILVRKPCEQCGRENADAHHMDYSKPFDITWLCQKHHMEWHKINDPMTAAADALMAEAGLTTGEAKQVITSIARGDIPAVKITY